MKTITAIIIIISMYGCYPDRSNDLAKAYRMGRELGRLEATIKIKNDLIECKENKIIRIKLHNEIWKMLDSIENNK